MPTLKQTWPDLVWQAKAKATFEADPTILRSKLDYARVSTEGVLRLTEAERLALNESIADLLSKKVEHVMDRMVRAALAADTSTTAPYPPPPLPHPPPPPIPAGARAQDHAADER